jgi:elongation factor 3
MNLGSRGEVEDDTEGEDLCDCEFTLAYGTKILLHNARLKLKKGAKYGLVGQNDCGKTTLMRAIADGSIDGFPDRQAVKPVFVETDIQGELSHLTCVNYILEWPSIREMGATEPEVRAILKSVGFSEGKSAGAGGDCDDPISALSGGWRMKLALARAMLQHADVLLLDEPTNHLDVKNVKWVESYINSLKNTTCVMVSHDSGLLDKCCTHMIQVSRTRRLFSLPSFVCGWGGWGCHCPLHPCIAALNTHTHHLLALPFLFQIDRLKLNTYKGNLSKFVETHPDAQSYFEFKAAKFTFSFPQPSFLEGVKSRGKALLKMDGVTFTYPGNTAPTINNVTVRASMASRVACVGVNGAGKSTLVKNLVGVVEPQIGTVWKYPNARIGYVLPRFCCSCAHALIVLLCVLCTACSFFVSFPDSLRTHTHRSCKPLVGSQVHFAARVPPHREAHGEDAQRVHPLALPVR